MQLNIGQTDKVLRFLAGTVIILSGIAFQSWWGLTGLVLLGTSLINWCPVYALLGINTLSRRKERKNGN